MHGQFYFWKRVHLAIQGHFVFDFTLVLMFVHIVNPSLITYPWRFSSHWSSIDSCIVLSYLIISHRCVNGTFSTLIIYSLLFYGFITILLLHLDSISIGSKSHMVSNPWWFWRSCIHICIWTNIGAHHTRWIDLDR